MLSPDARCARSPCRVSRPGCRAARGTWPADQSEVRMVVTWPVSANHSSPDQADPGVPRRALAVQTLVVTHDLPLPRHREHLKIMLFCYKNIKKKIFTKTKIFYTWLPPSPWHVDTPTLSPAFLPIVSIHCRPSPVIFKIRLFWRSWK